MKLKKDSNLLRGVILTAILVLIISMSIRANCQPLIGTCYEYDWKPSKLIGQAFIDSTSIKSFRYGITWGYIDSLLMRLDWGIPLLPIQRENTSRRKGMTYLPFSQ